MTTTDTIATIGHNNPPEPTPFELISVEINDLFDEAKTWADGEPIADEATHDAVTKIYDMIHDAGKRADAMRVEEKKPHDDAAKAVQAKYNPFVQKDKGKVDMAKAELNKLLAAWRARVAAEKAAEAARVAAIAAAEQAKARAALAASAGNLEARVEAEQQVEQAKAWGAAAKRADKAATTGLGLRTVWTATLMDSATALDWAFERDPARFTALVQDMANEAVRMGVRTIPGFVVTETKVAN